MVNAKGIRVLLFAALAVFLLLRGGIAEENDQQDMQERGERDRVVPSFVEEEAVFHLELSDGNIVPALRMDLGEYDQLMALWRLWRQGGEVATPDFEITHSEFSGRVDDERAILDATVRIRLESSAEGVRVPLDFRDSLLRRPPEYEGDGEYLFRHTGDDNGYVVWLTGDEGSEHTLRLKLVIPVQRTGNERRFAIAVPRTTNTSNATLDLPLPQAEVTVSGTPSPVVQLRSEGQTTEASIESNGGPMTISWRPTRPASHRETAVLEASGSLNVRIEQIENRQRIRNEATLQLRSYGGPIETFDVRLPPNTEYIDDPAQPHFQIETLNESADAGQRVRVRWVGEQTSGPVELSLLTELLEGPEMPEVLQAGGFEVIGGVRQWGHIDFTVDDVFSLEWEERQHVRRVRETPPEPKLLARYDYDHQPFSLQYRVERRPSRILVDPTYEVHVQSDQVVLDATFDYSIQGSLSTLNLDMTGWTVDMVGPDSAVQSGLVNFDQVSPLQLPLTSEAQNQSESLSVRLRAHRQLGDERPLSIPLPLPEDVTVNPAVVAIIPAGNVELTPRSEEMKGLIADPAPPELELPAGEQALFYRDRNTAEPSHFVADFGIRSRTVAVRSFSRLVVNPERTHVEQSLDYEVQFEPLAQLDLRVPRAVVESGDLRIYWQQQELDWQIAEQEDEDAGVGEEESEGEIEVVGQTSQAREQGSEPVQGDAQQADRTGLGQPASDFATIIAELPEAATGEHAVFLEYEVPRSEQEGATFRSDVLLVHPVPADDLTLVENRLALDAPRTVLAELRESRWRPDEAEGPIYTALPEVVQVPLDLTVLQDAPRHMATLERAWVQTWLSARERRDRVALRLRTAEPRVEIELPSGTHLGQVEVRVNGARHQAVRPTESGILIGIDDRLLNEPLLIELWYRFSDRRAGYGMTEIQMPRVAGADSAQRFYWQLVVPRNEHLIWEPANLVPDMNWTASQYFWHRTGRLQQQELEHWIGASQQDAMPHEGTNQYLFTSFDMVDRVQAMTAPRSVIVLAVGGICLIGGLLILKLSLFRRPVFLLLLGGALVGGAVWQPDLAVLLGQVAGFGLVLVILAGLIDWMFGRRYEQRSVVRGASVLSPDSQTTELQFPRTDGSSPSATESMPLTLTLPEAKLE